MRELFDMPSSMNGRPVDHRGFPVPWFVTEKDENGHWDFVNIHQSRFKQAILLNKCWVSGETLGKYKSFVIGPMCVVNRVSGDPPVKRDIAEWAVKVCPFLANPRAKRAGATEDIQEGQRGLLLNRNPGVSAIYTTKSFKYSNDGLMFLGDPESVNWYKEGRLATRDEVIEAIESGLPKLQDLAAEDGPKATEELKQYIERAMKYLPNE